MAVGTTGDDRDGGAGGRTDDSTVRLPQLAEDVAETRLSRIYHRAGEYVTAGEPLFECETDKVTVDVDAPVSGELTQWLVDEGDVVAVGAPVARVRPDGCPRTDASGASSRSGASGASSRTDASGAPGTSPAAEGEPPTPPALAPLRAAGSPAAAPAPTRAAGSGSGAEAERTGDGGPPKVRMAPLARKHARLLGVAPEELARIPRRGSLLTPSDIDRYLASARSDVPEEADAGDAPPRGAGSGAAGAPRPGGFDDVPLSPAQLRLNQVLERSRAEVTAGTVTVALDAASLRRATARLRTESGAGFVSDFQTLARLAALTARAHPRLRARLVGRDTLRIFHGVTLGVAVATDDSDLLVAGLPHADEGDFGTFARRWVAGLEEARAGRSTVDGTATLLVSSLDDDGALQAAPVVVPPAVATLMLGAAYPGPDGTRLLTLAYDHGVLNGREATRFLEAVRQRVQDTAGRPGQDTPVPPPAEQETGQETGNEARQEAGQDAGARPSRTPGSATIGRLTSLVEEITGGAPLPDRPLGEAGLTSKAAVQLVAAANETFGVRLPDTAVWHHPTIRSLAAAIEETAGRPAPEPGPEPTFESAPASSCSPAAGAGSVSPAPADAVPPAATGRDRAAVIGMACSFPGAEGPDAFWDLLERGECAVTELPPERLAGSAPATARETTGPARHRAGLLAEPDAFDAEFFGIPLRQARSMDPQQRLLLELSRHALEDAGLVPDRLAGSRTGVFVGASSYDFREHTVTAGGADGYATLGTFPTFLANRISYHYDLTGPSITVDTACSASLTALALAVAAIERGECGTALVGGVNLLSNSFNQDAFQQAGMLSPQGLSRAFDAGADGYVRGEGAAWLVLKAHRRAVADGDPLLAVVRGATANHGGRASGPTAPNPRAQTALIRDGLKQAGLSGLDLGYVEAHGTGTPLGDPIEMEALRAAVEPDPADGTHLARAAGPGGVLRVGSVKANIGHLEAAAGLAGVVKVLLAMRHGTIPGTPHFTRLNPAIDLSGSVLAVADRAVPWLSPEAPRRAAVSSFGIGGSNAHVVLEQVEPARAATRPGPGAWLLPLSVASPKALPVLARRLLAHLDRTVDRGRPVVLAEWAWTLQTGRQTHPVRRLLTVHDRAGLREALSALAEGEAHPAVFAPGGRHPDSTAGAERDAARTAEEWLADGRADWTAHWPEHDRPPRRIALPGHPFDRKRLPPLWQDGSSAPTSAPAVPAPPAAPPSVLVPRWVPAPPASRQDTATAPGTVLLVHDETTREQARAWAGHVAADLSAGQGGRGDAPRVSAIGRDEALPETGAGPVRVLFLVGGAQWPLDPTGQEELHRWLSALVGTARTLDARGTPGALTLVTTGLAAPEAPAGPGAAQQGALLGALRGLPHESPLLTVAAVDLPGPLSADASVCAAVWAEPCGAQAPLVSLGAAGGHRRVECLVPADTAGAAGAGSTGGTGVGTLWPDRSPVLIVFGGAGGVGGAVARHLAARRGARLILVGRSAPDASVREVVRAVRDSGGSAHYVRGDMREEADVAAAFAQCRERYGPPDAVLHAAGAAHDALLHELTDDALDPRLDAKLAALGPLHRARARFPGTALVLFSSFLGTFGSQGGLAYAAANACLDRVAAALDGPGTPTRAVAWGLWRDTGLARRYTDAVLAGFPGLETFTAEDGCAALERCVRAPHPSAVVIGGRPRALDAFRPEAVPPAGSPAADGGPSAEGSANTYDQEAPNVPEQRQADAGTADMGTANSANSADSADPADPADTAELKGLEERVRSVVRDVLPGDRPLPADLPWRELGLDSLLHVELTTALSRVFGPLPGTTLHEYGTISALARRFVGASGTDAASTGGNDSPPSGTAAGGGEARPDAPADTQLPAPGAPGAPVVPVAPVAPVPAGRPGDRQRQIAVIGLAGRYPGAPDLDSFWRLLSEGRSTVREVPADRWDWRVAHTLDAATTRWGCFLDGWDSFDAELFRIPPRDAAVLDPQERQFLQTAWEAFETAGYSRSRLSQRVSADRVGVYVGVTSHSNLLAQRDARLVGADNAEYGITAYSSIANRVSYAFDLNGPSLAVDTMCSSSLTAVHLACQALATGDAEVALAGGVHLFLHQDRFAALGSVGMTSPGPLNRAFGAGGDGFVPGEGAGAVVLKPLERAVADGDTVYAVITGSAVNHGGQGSGYTVPSPVAQADLVTRALERSGLRPHDIGYVEAHGTGTELGDPIEVRALARAFRTDPEARPGSVRIGSVKSNIGHGEAVAGVAGLTKAILQLWHRRLVPSLHARPENPRLELADGPLRVQHETEVWQAGTAGAPGVRRSAVSSFGAGGSNAHVVMEEFPVPDAPSRETGPLVLPLGAPDHDRLARVAERLAAVLGTPAETLTGTASLTDVAATLLHGRDDWPCRAAVVCTGPADRGEVVAALRALAAGDPHPALFAADGEGTPSQPAPSVPDRSPGADGKHGDTAVRWARAWVGSGDRTWWQPEPGTYRRVALPTTPFADSPHRVAEPPTGAVEAALLGARVSRALPLVEGAPENGALRVGLPHGHPWVADHVVDGEAIAPGALALETVLESLLAHGANPYEAAVEDVTFLAPWRGPGLTGSLAYEDGPPADGRHAFAISSAGAAVVRGAVELGGPRRTSTGLFDGLLAYAPERLSAVLADCGAGSADAFYRVLDAHGFTYGPGYRPVTAVSRSGGEVLARLVCDAPAGPAGRPVLHPAVLDGAFQAAGYAAMAPDGQRPTEWLRPLSVDRLVVHRPAVGPVYVHVRPSHGNTRRGVHLFDLRILDESGAAVADVDGFLLRAEPLEQETSAAPRTTAHRTTAPRTAALRTTDPEPSRPTAPSRREAAPSPRHDALRERTAPYTLRWSPDRAAAAEPGRRMLLIGGDGPLARALARRADAKLSWDAVAADDPDATRARVDSVLARLGPDAGVLVALDEDGPLSAPEAAATPHAAHDAYGRLATRAVLPLFAALRALVSSRRLDAGQVRLALCARPDTGVAAQYALHGLVRTVAGETGRFGVGLITVDRAWCERAPGEAESAVRAELAHGEPPAWVRLTAGARERAGLARLARAEQPFALRPDGCYLIVGGTGGLGGAVAESVLRRAPGARVVVTGRGTQAPPPGPGGATGAGQARAAYLPCDVTDPQSVSALADELDARGLRVNGVVCVAGVLRDGFLRTKTAAAVDEVCRVKLLGATALDAALAGHPLDFFVLASSIAVHVGNQGQSAYAFANGFLDGFAEARASGALGTRTGRTLAVGWPALAGGGMRPPASTLDHLRETYGLEPLPVDDAAEELWRLLGSVPASGGPAHTVLAHGDLDRWAAATGARSAVPDPVEAHEHPDFGAEAPEAVVEAAEAPEAADAQDAGSTPVQSPQTTPFDAAVRWLTGQVQTVTGLAAHALSPDADLAELGVDSIALTRLARTLESSLGHMPRSTLYDHDTIADLTRSLLDSHGPALTAVAAPAGPGGHRTGPEEPSGTAAPDEEPGEEPREEPGDWPVSERQIPLWTAEHAAAPYAPYNLSVAWRLAGDRGREEVAAALAALVGHHPALGKRLAPERGALRFLPASPAGAPPAHGGPGGAALPDGTLDVRTAPQGALFEALREEAGRPLPLDTGPALRAVLWQEDPGGAVLQLTVHHLVADGRSVELIGQSLDALLEDPAARPGPSGTASFGRFLAQEETDDRARAEAQRAWSERLRTVPPAPRFPGGTASAHPWAAGHAEYRMPASLRDRLRAAASAAGVSDFTVQLAAYVLAVGHATGRHSFLVSVPTYGRPGAEYDHTVGHFVNSVVVRVGPVAERSLRQWLTTLQDEIRSALALADLPYPSAAELCRAAGGDGAVPNLTFAYQNWPRPPGGSGGPLGERVFIQGQGGQWDLGLELTDGPDGVEILANHRSTALTPAELDAFVDTWYTLAAALADDLDAPARELTDPGTLTLPGRFRRLAARHPHAEAVRDTAGDSLSWAEVDRNTAAVARALRAAGVRPGEPVAVLVGRSCRLPVALLGVLRAGCPYVPLDASYPAERIRLILEDAGCALAVTERSEAGPLTGSGLRTVLLDELPADAPPPGGAATEDAGGTDGAAAAGGDAPAYLMFTSGSTGRPKGVSVSHRNVLHTLDAFRRLTGWSGRDRLLAVTTASFDISVLELFMPLVSGGRVVVADRGTVLDTSRLGRVLDDEGITVMQATPSGWQLLLDSGWDGRAGLTALCGGEALPPALARQLTSRVGSLWNVYGPTEATIWSTAARLSPGEPVVLGEPVGATELLVTATDDAGRPVSAGADGAGELWIGGPGVAHGYWRRPEQTADRFTAHPLEPGRGGRWFRTGDLVRRAADGALHFVGRADTQVKIRGHRLELGEIEAVLGEHPHAGRVVVLVQGEGAAARLVAVVVPRPGSAAPSAQELAEFAARRLPEWMRPQEYVFTTALPRTPNGKTDRGALAAGITGAAGPAGAGAGTAPGAGAAAGTAAGDGAAAAAGEDVGEEIAREWRELLGVEGVPRDRTFFATGGNSMLLGSLFVRLTARFPDARLVLGDLFSHPTLAGQQALVTERLAQARAGAPERPAGDGPAGAEGRPQGPAGSQGPAGADGGAAAALQQFSPQQLSPQQLRQARRQALRSAVTEAG